MESMEEYTIDLESKSNYKKMLRQLERRKNTHILSHGEYFFPDATGYYCIKFLTSNVGRLPQSELVYGMVDSDGNLL